MGLLGLFGYLVILFREMRRGWQAFERPTIDGKGNLDLGFVSVTVDESLPGRKELRGHGHQVALVVLVVESMKFIAGRACS